MTTPKLQMPELVVGQAGKELTHNQALAALDQLAQAVVVDKDLTAPPGSPANGSMYIVAAGATGAWAGQSGKLAYWLTTVAAWTFITPAAGMAVRVLDELDTAGLPKVYAYSGTAWVEQAGGSAGSGLTNLTEAKTTASPNATVPVVSLSVTITETHGDAAFCPKGNGALLADIPTGTTAGGNKRGINAVDLQFSRSSAAQVASGDYSAILGGDGNLASGAYSLVSGGNANSATALFTYVGGGSGNSATANFAGVPCGQSCTASGLHAVAYGKNNLSDGAGAGAYGIDSWSRGVQGACSYAAGKFYVRGDAQRVQYVLRKQTTDATPGRLAADGLNSTSQYQITLPNNGANAFSGSVVARSSTGDLVSAWEFKGAIKRGASAGTTALVGTPTVALLGQDAGASAWAFAITADTTTGCIAFTVTGAAATSIQWVAEVSTAEVNW